MRSTKSLLGALAIMALCAAASFAQSWTLSIQAPQGSGTTNLTTGPHVYAVGNSSAAVRATAASIWRFAEWTGTAVPVGHQLDNPITIPSGTVGQTLTLQAVFLLPASTLLVPSFDFPTIQSALDAAEDGDTIFIEDGIYTNDINTTTGFLPETFPLDFKGHNCILTSASGDPTAVTIDAGASNQVFNLHTGEQGSFDASLNPLGASLVALTITNGSATGDGGGLLLDGASPLISNCTITNSQASGNGGGIACINGAAPTIDSCNLNGNMAGAGLFNSGNGGAVSCTGGSNATLTNNTLINNTAAFNAADGKGGGIYCNGSSPTIDTNSITLNTAGDAGGGIACEAGSTAVINHNVITSNTAANSGGGISCDGSSPSITNQTSLGQADGQPGSIDSNTASTLDGGGIYCTNGSIPMIGNNQVTNNSATGVGGGIACDASSHAVIIVNTLSTNTAGTSGGGIAASNGSSPDVENNTLDSNVAQSGSGGGIYTAGAGSSPTIRNDTISNNTAAANGGGIYTEGTPVIAGNQIFSNTAQAGNGGGMHCTGSVSALDINHNLIRANTATGGGGGGICLDATRANIVNNTITGNTATRVNHQGGLGGGVYVTNFISFINPSIAVISNSILWGDTGFKGAELGVDTFTFRSTLTVAYSDVQGGQSAVFVGVGCTLNWYPGNIDLDPLFVSSTDFHEQSEGGHFAALFGLPATNPLAWVYDTQHSPSIDAGDGSPFSNELAPNGHRINMGVYGNTNEASKSRPLIQVIVVSAPVAVKFSRSVKITWTLIGLIKTDKITVDRVEWVGSSPFIPDPQDLGNPAKFKVTGTITRAPFAASFTAPRFPGIIIYYRVHATINGVNYYSNIGQIVVNPF